MRRPLGFPILLAGLGLGGWLLYNIFVHRSPSTADQPMLPAAIVAILFVYVGVKWTSGSQTG